MLTVGSIVLIGQGFEYWYMTRTGSESFIQDGIAVCIISVNAYSCKVHVVGAKSLCAIVPNQFLSI